VQCWGYEAGRSFGNVPGYNESSGVPQEIRP